MATWTVSTQDKKSVEEQEIWTKDGTIIRRVTGFRWGTFGVTTEDDDPPEFQLASTPGGSDDLDSINMYDCGYDSELVSLDDGWYGDIVFPEDMDAEEQERLTELWEEDSYDGWEQDGWYLDETEVWFWGPLDIVREED